MEKRRFRGRNVSDQWVYGSLVQTKEGEALIVTMEGRELTTIEKVEASTVGQDTGAYESTDGGAKIYEGDIIRIDGERKPCVVVFYEQAYGLADAEQYAFLRKGEHPFLNDYAHLRCLGDMEIQGLIRVIGNIHDNPELLEEGGGL